MFKVVITDYQYKDVETERRIIESAGGKLFAYQCKTEFELIEVCHDADAIIVQWCHITRAVIEHMKYCKVMVRYGIGVDNFDLEAASEKKIFVCNVPDYGIEEVSDQAVAFLMAMARKLPIAENNLKNGSWSYQKLIPLYRVAGSTVGIVGLGRIGRLFAKKVSGFGVRMIAYDPYVDKKEAEKIGVELVSFNTLVKEGDYISIHCPATPKTEGLFCRDVFNEMKSNAILINTARGAIIKEDDLVEALQKKQIRGAALDAYVKEPIDAKNPLLYMEQVICTPHCAWYTEDALSVLQEKVAEEVVNVLTGHKPWNPVNQF